MDGLVGEKTHLQRCASGLGKLAQTFPVGLGIFSGRSDQDVGNIEEF